MTKYAKSKFSTSLYEYFRDIRISTSENPEKTWQCHVLRFWKNRQNR